jgi:CubicO group peptidase (beta-lactamase class C family)
MARTGAPSGALAVVRDGQLVHEAAYGVRKAARLRWRVASLSKMWTASAIRILVARGALGYDTRVFPLLDIVPASGVDPRLASVTIQHLLDHAGGWDRDISGDPMFAQRAIARSLDVPTPPSMWQTAYYMFSRPLDFAPGSRSAYSNFGYGLLGLVIAAVTGLSYEDAVKRLVLAPLGITGMTLGRSVSTNDDEPEYTMPSGSGKAWSVFDPPGWVEWPYGGFALEPMAAHGGWIASVQDLARFAAALDDRSAIAVPRPETRPIPTRAGYRYWYVHTGALPGTYSILRRDWDGAHFTAACAVFDRRTGDGAVDGTISDELASAAAQVAAWPAGPDLLTGDVA